MSKTGIRDSNMELLRIVSMLMIMVQHANFMTIGIPTAQEAITQPVGTFFRFFVQAVTFVSVNVFVLLSGWYGIRFRANRLWEFFFQVLFFSLLVYVTLYGLGLAPALPVKRWLYLLTMQNYWFAVCYLLLYIFSPVLNAFGNSSLKSELCLVLCFAFFCEFVYGWLPSLYSSWFSNGYSPIHFMLLYLLGRYVRRFTPRWSGLNLRFDLALYFMSSLTLSFAYFGPLSIGGGNISLFLYAYCSPFAVFSSLFLLLAFSKIKLSSSLINKMALSCFSVYLLHNNPYFFDTFYMPFIRKWFTVYSTFSFMLITGIWIVGLFLLAIILDQIRLIIWKGIYSIIFSETIIK